MSKAAGARGASRETSNVMQRPRLRGWIHAGAVPLAIAGSWLLWRSSAPTPSVRVSVLVFGVCLVGLFAISSIYHVPNWRERVRDILGRCDAAMIQIFIAASFTPFAVFALDGAWRAGSLVVAWTIAVVGAGIALSPATGPRWLVAGSYVAFGWAGIVPFVRMARTLPWQALALIALGGLLYTFGSIVYALRRPDPSPVWFGFHEIFHVLVVAGGLVHFVAVWRFVLTPG